jgi:hypothetical protein
MTTKTSLLLITLILVGFSQLSGKIRNGYEARIAGARTSLSKLHAMLLDPCVPVEKKQKVRKEIDMLTKFVSCHELTAQLLVQLRTVCPGIYHEIDNIVDKRGRATDVYVKLVPEEDVRIPLRGASYFSRASVDEDANCSEYGNFTVSVNVQILGNALLILCHELGHVRYVVPNLASYRDFYATHYNQQRQNLSYIGHHSQDESGKSANAFMRRYVKAKGHYIKAGGKRPRPALALMQTIEKNNRRRKNFDPPETVLSDRQAESATPWPAGETLFHR